MVRIGLETLIGDGIDCLWLFLGVDRYLYAVVLFWVWVVGLGCGVGQRLTFGV